MWEHGFIYSMEKVWSQGFILDGFNGRCKGDLDMIGKKEEIKGILLNSLLKNIVKSEE
jgi:hypothetical protein